MLQRPTERHRAQCRPAGPRAESRPALLAVRPVRAPASGRAVLRGEEPVQHGEHRRRQSGRHRPTRFGDARRQRSRSTCSGKCGYDQRQMQLGLSSPSRRGSEVTGSGRKFPARSDRAPSAFQMSMRRCARLVCRARRSSSSTSVPLRAAARAPVGRAARRCRAGADAAQADATGTFMQTDAHPDDEDNGLLAMLGHGQGMRTTLVTATRGDGGQNEIGPEIVPGAGRAADRRTPRRPPVRRRRAVLHARDRFRLLVQRRESRSRSGATTRSSAITFATSARSGPTSSPDSCAAGRRRPASPGVRRD